MTGGLRPGERLTVRELAARLGTSSTPAREAILRLTTERALRSERGGTVRVPLPTCKEFLAIRDLRVLLEGHAGATAARLAPPKTVERLETLHAKRCTARSNGDFRQSLRYNQMFHTVLCEAADNPELLRIVEGLWVQAGPLLNFLIEHDPGVPEPSVHQHVAIIEGMRARDSEAVRLAIAADITIGGAPILKNLAGLDEQDVAPVSVEPEIVSAGTASTGTGTKAVALMKRTRR